MMSVCQSPNAIAEEVAFVIERAEANFLNFNGIDHMISRTKNSKFAGCIRNGIIKDSEI